MELVVLGVVLAVIAVTLAYTLITGISPVPTTPRVARAMLALLPDDVGDTIYELGAGWGTLALALARRYPRAQVVAYELSPLPWLVSVLWRRLAARPNLTLRRADFFAAPLGDAAVICCYLYPGAMRRLRAKFEDELAAGALVLSHGFVVPGWTPAVVRTADDAYGTKVYLYRMPPVTAAP